MENSYEAPVLRGNIIKRDNKMKRRNKNMEEDIPRNLEEFCDYIINYSDDIYVREQINGKWGSYALSELPTKLALKNIMVWIKEGMIPHRIIRKDEMKPRED